MIDYTRASNMFKIWGRESFDTLSPVALFFLIFKLWHAISSYMPYTWNVYGIVLLATAASLGGVYYRTWRYAYGTVLGGICLYYAIYRPLYFDHAQFESKHLMAGLMVLNLLAFVAAIIFKGRLLVCISIIGAFLVPAIFADLFGTMQFLVAYCLLILFLVMVASFVIDCYWINIVGFVGYLLYHETIFREITIDHRYGVLTLNEVFFIMGILFIAYTVVPIVATVVYKEHFSQSLLMAIVGAYTFLATEAAIAYQLQRVDQLPFFLRMWVKGVPNLLTIHIQMSWIYAAAYGACCGLLLFMNRHAKMLFASLLTLFCLSLVGLLYIHNFPFGELIVFLKTWIQETFLVAGAGFEPATFGL